MSVDRIRAAGVEIRLEGGRLFVRGPLTNEQRQWVSRHKPELVAELTGAARRRPIVEYQFDGDPRWHTMLGRPGETFKTASDDCRRMFPNVVATRERNNLPAGFPFKRHGGEGEFKRADGTDL